jgi:large repetitive protein
VSASASVVTHVPVMTSTYSTDDADIPSTSIGFGELVSFTVNVTLLQATALNTVMVFALPSSGKMVVMNATLQYFPSSVTASAVSYLTTGSTVSSTDSNDDKINDMTTFNFRTITNPAHPANNPLDVIIMNLVALMIDNSNTTSGQLITTYFQFSYYTTTTVFSTLTTSLLVVAPALTLTKTVSPTINVQEGETVSYTLTLSQMSVTSTAPAYLVVVTDMLPNMTLLFLSL